MYCLMTRDMLQQGNLKVANIENQRHSGNIVVYFYKRYSLLNLSDTECN